MASIHPLLHLLLSSPRQLLIRTLLFALPSHSASIISSPPTPFSNSSLALPPLPDPLTAGRDLQCFKLTTPKAYPVDPSDCPSAIDLLYHDPTGVMSLQKFSHNPILISTFRVPYAWQFRTCQVLLTSGGALAVDTFRLADVIVKAERIIEECPPKSKKSLGGLALVGNGETFFVAVNGPDLAPDADGEGEGEGEGEEDAGAEEGGVGSGDIMGFVLGGVGDGAGVAVADPDLRTEGLIASSEMGAS